MAFRGYTCSKQARDGMTRKLVDYVARHGRVRVRDVLAAKGWGQVAGHFAVQQAEREGFITTEMVEGVQYVAITEPGLDLAAEVADDQLRKRNEGAYA